MKHPLTPYYRQQARELCTLLPIIRDRCLKIGLLRTGRVVNEACQQIGWELAELEKEDQVEVHMRPPKPMELGPTEKWLGKFIAAHDGDLKRAERTATKEFITARDVRRVTFWAEVSRHLIRQQPALST